MENCIVDPETPPLQDGALSAEPTEGPSSRLYVSRRQKTKRDGSRSLPGDYTNIFTSRLNDASQGRGINLLNLTPRCLGRKRLFTMILNSLQDRDFSRSRTRAGKWGK